MVSLRYPRRTPRSATGFSLDEVENAAYLQVQLMQYTKKQPGGQGCWLWTGPKLAYQNHGRWQWRARMFVVLTKGYTQISPARAAYLFDAGELPDRRRIRHTCGESLCVRPDHIVLSEPSKTYWSRIKPHQKQREREEMARLMADRAIDGVSGETVEQIKFYYWLGEPIKSIARNFGLKERVVERILEKSGDLASEPGELHAV
jgi:hypothetical protein